MSIPNPGWTDRSGDGERAGAGQAGAVLAAV